MDLWTDLTTSDIPPAHILGQAVYLSWVIQTDTWKKSWTFHVVFFSFCFSFLAIYSVYGVVRSQIRKEKVIRILAYIVHILIGLLGLTRLLTLSVFSSEIKATSVNNNLYKVVSRIIFGIGFPCITSAFALVQISFTEALKGKLSTSKLGNFTFIGLVISFHFLVVLIVGTLTTVISNLFVLFFATKFYFLIMTAVTMVIMLYSGCKVLSHVAEHERALSDLNQHYGSTLALRERTESNTERDKKRSLLKIKIILFLTSLFCLLICGMEIHSIAELAELLAGKDGALAPWSWYVYQTFFRLAELGLAGTILYTMAPQELTDNKNYFNNEKLHWKNIFRQDKKDKSSKKSKNDKGGDVGTMAMVNRAYDQRTYN
ncbi:uncharacterized protein LOC116287213 [Actinia tenebrosa]|uniref:Uncharacterized protein LOC116287213 n=1 Tax=Actinia tenebrosa TaxID=6105 RepID=A0A6P8GZX5_ACTTE|nr:uncharacterized protein LOC116287213 [Actinia tenebrosa]